MRYSLSELGPVTPGHDKAEAFRKAVTAAQDAEGFGYHRVWYGEHPGATGYIAQESVPIIAAATQRTSRIRLGSGATLTRHYSAFTIAERFLMLDALAPDRIDVGLGRSTGAFPVVEYAMRRNRDAAPPSDFSEYLQEIIGHVHDAFPAGHPFASIGLANAGDGKPEIWVLGSSGSTAALAGQLGVGFAFGAQINPEPFVEALTTYREHFTPTPFGSGRPEAMLGLNIVAADDEESAHQLTWPARAMRARGEDRAIPTLAQARAELGDADKNGTSTVENGVIPAQISGTPESLRQQIEPLVRASGATEVIVQDMMGDTDLRRRSRELVAEALASIG